MPTAGQESQHGMGEWASLALIRCLPSCNVTCNVTSWLLKNIDLTPCLAPSSMKRCHLHSSNAILLSKHWNNIEIIIYWAASWYTSYSRNWELIGLSRTHTPSSLIFYSHIIIPKGPEILLSVYLRDKPAKEILLILSDSPETSCTLPQW